MKYENIWNSIKSDFGEGHDESKLERQLDLFNTWTKTTRGIIEAVTGFGKTMIAHIAIKRMNLNDFRRKIIVVVPNDSLKQDWEKSQYGYIDRLMLKNVKVYVVNSYTMYDRRWNCDLLILDEIHRFANEDSTYFSTVLERTDCKFILGLSATLDSKQKEFLSRFDINIVGSVGLQEAEVNGWISNYIVYNIGVDLDISDTERLSYMNESHNNYYAKFSYDFRLAIGCATGKRSKQNRVNYANKMGWVDSMGDDHNWSPKSIQQYAGKWFYFMRERRDFLHKAINKTKMVERIIDNTDYKTIVFTESIDISDQIHKRIGDISSCYHSKVPTRVYNNKNLNKFIGNKTDKGYFLVESAETVDLKRLKEMYPNYHRVADKKLKELIKNAFISNKFRVLITARALDEGFDCKDIEMGIIHSGSSVARQEIQRIGRVLRSNKNKYAIIVNIYVKNSQDEKWLVNRTKGIPVSKMKWIESVDEIVIPENNDIVIC